MLSYSIYFYPSAFAGAIRAKAPHLPGRGFAPPWGNASLAIPPSGGAAPPILKWFSTGVAYSPLAHSRLGFSPYLGLDTAYHTTSCTSASKTKRCLDKKSGPIIERALYFPTRGKVCPGVRLYLSRSPVRTAAWGGAAPHCPGIPYHHGFYNRLIPRKDQINA